MTNEINKKTIWSPMILKLYAHGLRLLFDWNWASTNFFEEIRTEIKKGKTILREPTKFGVAFLLGKIIYEEYLLDEYDFLYIEEIKDEDLVFYLEDVIDFLEFHGANINIKPISEFHDFLSEINKLYENFQEQEYYNRIQNKQRWLRAIYRKILSNYRSSIFMPLLNHYAKIIAERIIHDRELCNHISNILIIIGFDGNSDSNPPKQWVKRKPIPKWVKESLLFREGNRCAQCNLKDQKLTLDHIIPLSKAGTNDIVNLQFICHACNQLKSNSKVPVEKSIPSYLDRKINQ